MASRSLTDRMEGVLSTLHPSLFLVGRIRNQSLDLRCTRPKDGALLWQTAGLPLGGEGVSPDLAALPIPMTHRKSVPFLLLWPSEWCFGALVPIPLAVTAQEREMAISVEMEGLIPWPIDESTLAFDTERSESQSSCFVWATRSSLLMTVLSCLQRAGFDPQWIMPESLPEIPTPSPPSSLFGHTPLEAVILGDETRTQVVLFRNGHVRGEATVLHPSPEGLESRDAEIADHFLAWASEGQIPERLSLAPGTPVTPFFAQLTGDFLETPTRTTPPDGWRLTRSLSRQRSQELSFRKGPLAYQGDRTEQRSGIRVLVSLSILLLFVLVLDAGVHLTRMTHRVDRAREVLAQDARLALPGHQIVEPVTQLRQELATLDREKNLLSRGPDIIRILKDLTQAPPQGVRFELVSFDLTPRSFTVSGKTDSFRSVDRIKKSLASTGHLKDLSIQSAGLDIDRKTVTFRIRGRHD